MGGRLAEVHAQGSIATLVDLLTGMFTEHELRAFVALRVLGGERVAALLPGAGTPLAHLVEATVLTLVHHGLVTPALFEALIARVPGRLEDIERAAAAWSPDDVVPPPPPPADGAWDVFIAYASADAAWVHQLAADLHAHELRVFLDEWEIGAGDVVVQRLDEGLRASRNGVLVLSPAAVANPWVMQAYAALLTRAVESRLRLVPVLYTDAVLPPMLATRAWVDLRGKSGVAYHEEVRRLARALRGERPGPPPRSGSPTR